MHLTLFARIVGILVASWCWLFASAALAQILPGATQPFGGTILKAKVPAHWAITESQRDGQVFLWAIDPQSGGLAGVARIAVPQESAEQAFSAFQSEAADILMQRGEVTLSPVAPRGWTFAGDVRGQMGWQAGRSQPSQMETYGRVEAGSLVVLVVAWPEDDRGRAVVADVVVSASPDALAAPAQPQASPPPPVKAERASRGSRSAGAAATPLAPELAPGAGLAQDPAGPDAPRAATDDAAIVEPRASGRPTRGKRSSSKAAPVAAPESAPKPAPAPESDAKPDLGTKPTLRMPTVTTKPPAPQPAPEVSDQQVEEIVLFDGKVIPPWEPLAANGGNFEEFARIENGVLLVDVPDGNSWGKTGLRTTEPMVIVPAGKILNSAMRVRFDFAPEATDNFVISLSKTVEDEWHGHDLRFGWATTPETGEGIATLYYRRKPVWSTRTDQEPMQRVEMTIGTDGVVKVVFGENRVMEFVLPDGPINEGYHLNVLSHAVENGLGSKMALKRITAWEVDPEGPRLPVWPNMPTEAVLFDGQLGEAWTRWTQRGAVADDHLRLGPEGMVVSIPESIGWAKAGIMTGTPVVWLDDFGPTAEAEITFEIDTEKTDAFRLSVGTIGWGGVMGNEQTNPRILYEWLRSKDGSKGLSKAHLNHDKREPEEGAPMAPETVRFVIRPGEVSVEAAGYMPVVHSFPQMAEGVGLYLYLYGFNTEANPTSQFGLRSVHLRRHPVATLAATPLPGVEGLPETALFAGALEPLWEGSGISPGYYAEYGRIDGGRMVIDSPADVSHARTGLLSLEPVVRLDRRVEIAPYRLAFHVEPSGTSGLMLAFRSGRRPDMWKDPGAVAEIIAHDSGVLAGLHSMHVRNGYYNAHTRLIDSEWLKANWDGWLWTDIAHTRLTFGVPDGPKVSAGEIASTAGTKWNLAVYSAGPGEYAPTSLVLDQAVAGWLPPPMMNEGLRLRMLDDGDFDAEAFIGFLRSELGEVLP